MITVTIKIKGDSNKVVVLSAAVKRGKQVTPQEEMAEKVMHQFYDAANVTLGLLCKTHVHVAEGGLSAEAEKQFRKFVLDMHKGKKTG